MPASRIQSVVWGPVFNTVLVVAIIAIPTVISVNIEQRTIEEHLEHLDDVDRELDRRLSEIIGALSPGAERAPEVGRGDAALPVPAPPRLQPAGSAARQALDNAEATARFRDEAHRSNLRWITERQERVTTYQLGMAALGMILVLGVGIRGVRLTAERVAEVQRSTGELARTEARLRRIVDCTFDIIAEVDFDGNPVFANPRLARVQGLSLDEVMKRNAWEAFTPDDIARLRPLIKQSLATFTPVETEYRLRHRDGTVRWFEATIQPIRTPEGEVHFISFGRDITDQRAERELNSHLLKTIDASGDLIAINTPDERFTYLSAGGRALVGLPEDQSLCDLTSQDLFTDAEREVRPASMTESIEASGRWEGVSFLKNFQTGEEIPVHNVSIALTDPESGEVVAYGSVTRDITFLRQAEDERARLARDKARHQRLTSIGLLAGGVAHDFNNLLTSVQLDLAHLRIALGEEREFHPAIESLEDATKQMVSLAKQLLVFAATERVEKERIDLHSAIRTSVRLVSHLVAKNAHVETGVEPDITADVNRSQLTQLLTNLILNASEALGGRSGTIRVRARRFEDPGTHRAFPNGGGSPGVILEVSDTGRGIEEADQEHIFDPFYTTKSDGTGLGLAAVSGIVRSHAGSIQVESHPGAGTTFFIFLPDSDEAEVASRAPEALSGTAACAGEADRVGSPDAVLVVDDEHTILETVSRYLEVEGISVITAADAASAKTALTQHHDRISMALVDLRLGDSNGVDLFKSLRRIRPDLRGILCSAELGTCSQEAFTESGFEGFLAKPYTFGELLDLVGRQPDPRSETQNRI